MTPIRTTLRSTPPFARLQVVTKYLATAIWGVGLLLVVKRATPDDYIGPGLAQTLLLGLLVGGLLVLIADAENFARRRSAFVVAALSLASMVFLLEVPALLGFMDYGRVCAGRVSNPMLSANNVLDPILLHRRRPLLELKGETPGGDLCGIYGVPAFRPYRFSAEYDEKGFRNPPGMTCADIAVIGDSFIEMGITPDEDLFTSVLRRGSHLEVANFGQASYGPQQELEVLRRFVFPLKPTVCIWALFEGNDLSDAATYPIRQAKCAELAEPVNVLKRRSFLWNMQQVLRTTLLAADPQSDLTRHVGRYSAGGEPIDYYFHYALRPIDDYAVQFDEIGRILAAAHEECREREIRFVVLFIPAKYRVYHDLCSFPPGSVCSDWVVNELPRRLELRVEGISSEITFVDCTEALRAAAKGGELVYFPDDTHWSAAGQRIAAELVLGRLNLSRPIEPGSLAGPNRQHP